MKTLGLQLRFLVPLILILAGAAYLAVPVMDRLTLRWFARDLDMRGMLVANALSESVVDAVNDPKGRKMQALCSTSASSPSACARPAASWCAAPTTSRRT